MTWAPRDPVELSRNRRHWTATEDARLIRLYPIYPVPDLASRLGRTAYGIQKRIGRLREIGKIRDDMSTLTTVDIGQLLGVSRHTVHGWHRRGVLQTSLPGTLIVFTQADVLRAIRESLPLRAPLRPRPGSMWAEEVAKATVALQQRYIWTHPLAAALCIGLRGMLRWRRKGFPVPALITGEGHGPSRAYLERTAVIAWLDAHPERWTVAAYRLLRGAR